VSLLTLNHKIKQVLGTRFSERGEIESCAIRICCNDGEKKKGNRCTKSREEGLFRGSGEEEKGPFESGKEYALKKEWTGLLSTAVNTIDKSLTQRKLR